MMRLNIGITLMMVVLFVNIIMLTTPANCENDNIVTCHSVIKLRHKVQSCTLHSHQVNYGSGSGQQSVTCFPGTGDANSYWIVKAAYGSTEDTCPPGKALTHKMKISLEHANTHCRLHSHLHRSPLTQQQEVSCFPTGDTGDNWVVELISGSEWTKGKPIRLQHVDTGKFLHSHNHRFGRPIANQLEVTGFEQRENQENLWTAEEGIYYPVTTK